MICPDCQKKPCECDKLYRFDQRSTVDYRRKQKEMKQRRAEKKAKKDKKVTDE